MSSKIGFLAVLYIFFVVFFTGVFTGLFAETSGLGPCVILGVLASNFVYYWWFVVRKM